MRDEHAEVRDAQLLGPPHRHRVGWRGRFEPYREEHDFLVRILPGELQRVERRVDDPHRSATRPHLQEIAVAAGNPQHVAEGREDHVRPRCQRERLVDLLERRHADGTSGTVYHLHGVAQQFVQALLDDRVGLAAAHFHEHPAARRCALDLRHERARDFGIAVFAEVPHGASSFIHSSSSSWLISRSTANVRRASASSTLEIANPTWTIA